MNAISKALMDIKFSINRNILDITFMQNIRKQGELIGLDDRITSSVIRERVLIDSNLVGGVHLNVLVSDCEKVYTDDYYTVVRIPDKLLKNRSVVSALSLTGGSPSISQGGDSQIMTSLNVMQNNMNKSAGGLQTARLELIGHNTILIDEYMTLTGTEYIRMIIENDSELNNISPRSYIAFGQLCVLATKSYIHNNLEVDVEKGYIYRGHELSTIQNIVDRYADSEELYQEYIRTKWAKIQFMNDNLRYSRHIKHMFGNNT